MGIGLSILETHTDRVHTISYIGAAAIENADANCLRAKNTPLRASSSAQRRHQEAKTKVAERGANGAVAEMPAMKNPITTSSRRNGKKK